EITHFSYDDTHTLVHSAASLKSYYPPSLPAQLSNGFSTFIKHDDNIDEHLDGLLCALERLERRTGERTRADVVTWRGMMTKFMTAPFEGRDGWEMNVVVLQGTLFIEENHAYKQQSRGKQDRRGEEMSYWGYKFEALSTIPGNWDECPREVIEARDEEVVSNEAQFCSIVKTGFGDTRVVIGGEVDAVWNSNPPTDPNNPPIYIELKTSKIIDLNNPRDGVNYERKLLRFWAQSFLLGIAKVIVGFRDDSGTLRSLRTYETQELPGIARRSGRNLWDAKVSIDFTAGLLAWLRETVGGEEEGVVWRVRFRARGDRVEVERTGERSFLTEGFVRWREELAAGSAAGEKLEEKW
ncbi:RAI1-domain-containing protein, partial [Morchella conica CCBAS932]